MACFGQIIGALIELQTRRVLFISRALCEPSVKRLRPSLCCNINEPHWGTFPSLWWMQASVVCCESLQQTLSCLLTYTQWVLIHFLKMSSVLMWKKCLLETTAVSVSYFCNPPSKIESNMFDWFVGCIYWWSDLSDRCVLSQVTIYYISLSLSLQWRRKEHVLFQ